MSYLVSTHIYHYAYYKTIICVSQYSTVCLYSEKSEDKELKKRKVCRCAAGVEETPNKCNTPGFPIRKEPTFVRDLRGFDRLELPWNDRRIVVSSGWLLQGWRANCDIQVLLYQCDPSEPNPEEIARVTDYIV